MNTIKTVSAALCGLWLMVVPALADDHADHERAREALATGRILPLETILQRVKAERTGDVLDVELDDEDDGSFVYEIKLLTPDARVVKLEYDAATGNLLRTRERRR